MELNATEIFNGLFSLLQVSGELDQVQKQIKSCRSNGELIEFIRGWMRFSKAMDFFKLKGDPKDNAKAVECRKRGNEFFHPKVRKYIEAIKLYNESIALAEDNSEALALAYANRSAVCFELKEYEDCLKNIRLARKNPYPVNLMPKLEQREATCRAMLKRADYQKPKDAQPIELELSYEPNLKIPHIADCLELVREDHSGRFLITNRNLKAGDIIAIEEPFSREIVTDLRYTNCNYCLEDRFLTLKPCKSCTITMFCSENCTLKASQSYHRIECPILKDIYEQFERVFVDALRNTVLAVNTFDCDPEELRMFMESAELNSLNLLEYDWTTIDAKKTYAVVHSLETHQNKRPPDHMAQYAISSILISDALLRKTELQDACKNQKALREITEQLLVRHAMIHPVNAISTYFRDYENRTFKTKEFTRSLFPIWSMVNHSCAPNLHPIYCPGGKLAMQVTRPIQKGSRLLIKYCENFPTEPLEKRRDHLSKNYFFECQCEACINDYPQVESSPHVLQDKIKLETMTFCRGKKRDPKNPADMLELYLHLMNKFDSHYPCRDIEELLKLVTINCYDLYWSKSRKLKYKDVCNI